MSVLVWECREGLLKQRPFSRGSPVPGERKGSPGKGRGSQCPPGKRLRTACDLDCDLGHDKLQSAQLSPQQDVQMLRNTGSSVAWGRDPEPVAPTVCHRVSDTPVLPTTPLHLTLHVCPPALLKLLSLAACPPVLSLPLLK